MFSQKGVLLFLNTGCGAHSVTAITVKASSFRSLLKTESFIGLTVEIASQFNSGNI